MELTKDYPSLQPFAAHRVILLGLSGTSQALGICPFCGKEGFYIHLEKQMWDCKHDGRSGNLYTFFDQISAVYEAEITGELLEELASNRSLMVETFRRWRVGWNGVTYTIPTVLTRYPTTIRMHLPGRRNPMATPGAKVGLGCNRVNTGTVWLCEGEWDAMALDEAFHRTGIAQAVYFAPGAGVLPRHEVEHFIGKSVNLLYDNDLAGQHGTRRAISILSGVTNNIRLIKWPPGYPDGFDIRDLYKKCGRDPEKFLSDMGALLEVYTGDGSTRIPALPDTPPEHTAGLSRKDVMAAFQSKLYLPDPTPIDVVFGVCFANRLPGEPLWMFLMGPPGGTKSTLVQGLESSYYGRLVENITPSALISGFRAGKDPSLIPKLNGKIAIIKDFTAILSMNSNAREEIFGILRGAYDGRCVRDCGNGIVRAYNSKFGIIAAVTTILEMYVLTHPMLGERFLRYRIKRAGLVKSDDLLLQKAIDNITKEEEIKMELGQVCHECLDRKIEASDIPTIPQAFTHKIIRLAQWTARMRAAIVRERYTREVLSLPASEIATRLVKQLCKLMMGCAIFDGRREVNAHDYEVAVEVARDTCPERVEAITRALYTHGRARDAQELAVLTNLPAGTIASMMLDLQILRIAKFHNGHWYLTSTINRLIAEYQIYKGRPGYIQYASIPEEEEEEEEEEETDGNNA